MAAPVAVPVDVAGIPVGGGHPLVLIAGPDVIEDDASTRRTAEALARVAEKAQVPLIFKCSYDKANRTSLGSYRGPGLAAGLPVLARVRRDLGLPVLSDVHAVDQVEAAAEVLDVLQIPAFLCRQTDLIVAAARTGKVVNLKKGQFLSPQEMPYVAAKAASTGNRRLLLTERGTTFGYGTLVVDMRSLPILRATGYPVVFDATHSVQVPGGAGGASGGDRRFVPVLARAAVAAGIDALFLEVHEEPDRALCDGPSSLRLADLPALLEILVEIHATAARCADDRVT